MLRRGFPRCAAEGGRLSRIGIASDHGGYELKSICSRCCTGPVMR
jgi:hypothetical protein